MFKVQATAIGYVLTSKISRQFTSEENKLSSWVIKKIE